MNLLPLPRKKIVVPHHAVWLLVIVVLLVLFGLLLGTIGKLASPAFESRPQPTKEVERGPMGQRLVAMTFDAGGEIGGFPKLLTGLDAAHVHATFFITGLWATQHPDLVKALRRKGHEIGNHTWSHRDLTQLPDEEVRTELLQTDAILTRLTGRSPRPLWRAPFGARDTRVLRIASQIGYTSIYWSLDSEDSVGEKKSPAFLTARIAARPAALLDGAIILMHVGEPTTAEAVPAILAELRRKGLSQVMVSRLLRFRSR